MTLNADLLETHPKQGGNIYLSREHNGPVVSNEVDEPSQVLMMPCLAWDEVPAHGEQSCISFADPHRPEHFIRTYDFYIEWDPDYSPRRPETFEMDASFFFWEDHFYPEYAVFESISYPLHFMHVGHQSRIETSRNDGTAEFRNAASFYCTHISLWSKSFIHTCLIYVTGDFIHQQFDRRCTAID